ncbi:MAG: hypothetical protein AB7P76_09880 [Candidatus Melainabacteria bacterium]
MPFDTNPPVNETSPGHAPLPTVGVDDFYAVKPSYDAESEAILDAVRGPSLSFYQEDATDHLPFSRLVGMLRPNRVTQVIDEAASRLFDDRSTQYQKALDHQLTEAEDQLEQVKHRLKHTWHRPPSAKSARPEAQRRKTPRKPVERFMSIPVRRDQSVPSGKPMPPRERVRWEYQGSQDSAFTPVAGLDTAGRPDTLAYDRILDRFRKRLEDQITDLQSHTQRAVNQLHNEIDTLRTDVRRLGEQQQDLLENVQQTFQDEVFRVQCDTQKQVDRCQKTVQQDIHAIRTQIDSVVAEYFDQYLEEAATDMPESRDLKPGHRLVMQRIRKNIDDMDARQQKQADRLEQFKGEQQQFQLEIFRKQSEAINEVIAKYQGDHAALRETVSTIKSSIATDMVVMKQQIQQAIEAIQPKIREELTALMKGEALKIKAEPVRLESLHDGVKLTSESYTQVSLVPAATEPPTPQPAVVAPEPEIIRTQSQGFIRPGDTVFRVAPVKSAPVSQPAPAAEAAPQAMTPAPVALAPEPIAAVSADFDNPVFSMVARRNRQMANRMNQLINGYFQG